MARRSPAASIGRTALAELIGSALLVATVIGTASAAEARTGDPALQLLINALATGAVLVALILALSPVSAAFNPVVTAVERAFGAIGTRTAIVHVAAQVVGAILGALVAAAMFAAPVGWSHTSRSAGHLWLGEVVATFGLVLVIFGLVRSGRLSQIAFAVGGYIAAAYWFTSSTSFANPAVTIARTLTHTGAGIAPKSVPMFVLAQVVGAALAAGVVSVLHVSPHESARALVEEKQ